MGILDFLSKPLSPEEPEGEGVEFLDWYADLAKKSDLSLDPDDPRHYYDYRAAYEAGVEFDERRHLPSRFKHDLHPERYIIGKDLEIYDTKYERPARLEDMIIQAFQRKEHEQDLFR